MTKTTKRRSTIEQVPYTAEGYIDMRALLDKERLPFIFITSLRGPGKTWGAIDYALRCQDKPFIFMRRTQVQADFAGSVVSTPLEKNLRPDETIVQVKTGVKHLTRLDVVRIREDGAEPDLVGTCYVVALSTVASMRGINMDMCDILIYDEFIKEPHERPLTKEFSAFKNAYETFNRNRELYGRPPLRVVALSNALDIANPIYRGLGVVNEVYKMTGEIFRDARQGAAIYRPKAEFFKSKKQKTALYQLEGAADTMGGDWADMDTSAVKSLNLKGAAPVCGINQVGFYVMNNRYYASATVPRGVSVFDMSDKIDVAAVHKKYQPVISAIFRRDVVFESVDIMLRCQELANML